MLIEEYIQKLEDKVDKEVEKASKRFGEAFDEEKFRTTDRRILDIVAQERCYP